MKLPIIVLGLLAGGVASSVQAESETGVADICQADKFRQVSAVTRPYFSWFSFTEKSEKGYFFGIDRPILRSIGQAINQCENPVASAGQFIKDNGRSITLDGLRIFLEQFSISDRASVMTAFISSQPVNSIDVANLEDLGKELEIAVTPELAGLYAKHRRARVLLEVMQAGHMTVHYGSAFSFTQKTEGTFKVIRTVDMPEIARIINLSPDPTETAREYVALKGDNLSVEGLKYLLSNLKADQAAVLAAFIASQPITTEDLGTIESIRRDLRISMSKELSASYSAHFGPIESTVVSPETQRRLLLESINQVMETLGVASTNSLGFEECKPNRGFRPRFRNFLYSNRSILETRFKRIGNINTIFR